MNDALSISCLSAERQRELKAACVKLVRRAVLTLKAWPDSDRRYLTTNLRSSMPTPVLGWLAYKRDEFDQSREKPRFRPTPRDRSRCLEVLGWLTWYECLGENERRDARVIVAWSLGVPWPVLAERHGRSDDTMRRWIDGAFARIMGQYWRDVDRLS